MCSRGKTILSSLYVCVCVSACRPKKILSRLAEALTDVMLNTNNDIQMFLYLIRVEPFFLPATSSYWFLCSTVRDIIDHTGVYLHCTEVKHKARGKYSMNTL